MCRAVHAAPRLPAKPDYGSWHEPHAVEAGWGAAGRADVQAVGGHRSHPRDGDLWAEVHEIAGDASVGSLQLIGRIAQGAPSDADIIAFLSNGGDAQNRSLALAQAAGHDDRLEASQPNARPCGQLIGYRVDESTSALRFAATSPWWSTRGPGGC